MAKKRDVMSIQGKDMVAKYGAVACQHLYKWTRFGRVKGFYSLMSILDGVMDGLDLRDAFMQFIEDPTETAREGLLDLGGALSFAPWLPVSKSGSPSWEALKWVYSEPAHYFEVLRVLFKIRKDVPPRYKQVTPALIDFFTKQVPEALPEGSQLPIPAPRAPYGSKSKSSDDSDSESEAAVADPGREERIFSRTSGRVLEILEKEGLSLDASDKEISKAMSQSSCPLAYQCQPGKDCPGCPRLHGILEELRKRRIQEPVKRAEAAVSTKPLPKSSVEILREAARNAAKAAVLDGLCRDNKEIAKLVEQVLHGLF